MELDVSGAYRLLEVPRMEHGAYSLGSTLDLQCLLSSDNVAVPLNNRDRHT